MTYKEACNIIKSQGFVDIAIYDGYDPIPVFCAKVATILSNKLQRPVYSMGSIGNDFYRFQVEKFRTNEQAAATLLQKDDEF